MGGCERCRPMARISGTAILALLIIVFTLGVGAPFAIVLCQRWWAIVTAGI